MEAIDQIDQTGSKKSGEHLILFQNLFSQQNIISTQYLILLYVSKIVALITMHDVVFTRLKQYFKVCALIFYVCEGSSLAIANQLNIQKIMVSIFFDYEVHYL